MTFKTSSSSKIFFLLTHTREGIYEIVCVIKYYDVQLKSSQKREPKKCDFVHEKDERTKLHTGDFVKILEINVEEVWKSNLLLLLLIFHDNCQ